MIIFPRNVVRSTVSRWKLPYSTTLFGACSNIGYIAFRCESSKDLIPLVLLILFIAIASVLPKCYRKRCKETVPTKLHDQRTLSSTTQRTSCVPDVVDQPQHQQHLYLNQLRRKRDFLARAGDDYGYRNSPAGFIDDWRDFEFPLLISPIRLDSKVPFTEPGPAVSKNTKCGPNPSPDDNTCEQQVYADYAGAALPTRSQWKATTNETDSPLLLANPHSTGPSAGHTSLLIEQAKKRILEFFSATPGQFGGPLSSRALPDTTGISRKENQQYPQRQETFHPGYEIVFTSNATDALRIVAERFPWKTAKSTSCQCQCQQASTLVYPQDSHTSVVGMRGPVLQKGGRLICRPATDLLLDMDKPQGVRTWSSLPSEGLRESHPCNCCKNEVTNHLLVLAAECNFSGDRKNVKRAFRRVRESSNAIETSDRWFTMLDMAKAASSAPINLRSLDPDFACVSFYKLFGMPTGLGCLLVKRGAAVELLKENQNIYFGGGSVDVLLPSTDYVVHRSGPTSLASLTNGTVHFRGIASLVHGFDALAHVGGMHSIEGHTVTLAREFASRISAMQHANCRPLVEIHSSWAKAGKALRHGPTVTFNVLRSDGAYVGFNEVSKLAALNRPPIQMRTGCFCNPGACQLALGLSDNDVRHNYEASGHVCGDQMDVINGRPTGAIRVSFGKDSIWEDADAIVTFLERIFVSVQSLDNKSNVGWDASPRRVMLSEMYIFPIKSCAAFRVKRWKFDAISTKPDFDREFALVDSSGTAMRLQSYPKMAYIQPHIDVSRRVMTVHAPGQSPLELHLDTDSSNTIEIDSVVKICGNRCGARVWGDCSVSEWFSSFLGVQCWLARHSVYGNQQVSSKYAVPSTAARRQSVAFANEQPILLISEHAVDTLNESLRAQHQKQVSSRHFRPNMVVRLVGQQFQNDALHAEDAWSTIQNNSKEIVFDVVGPCARCSMVDVDPSSGMKGNTLRALAEYRRQNGQIIFGIFLKGRTARSESEKRADMWLEEGDFFLSE